MRIDSSTMAFSGSERPKDRPEKEINPYFDTLPAPPSDAEEKARRKKRNDRITTGIVLLSLTMYVNGFEKSWRDIKRLVKYMVTPAAKAPANPGNKAGDIKGNGLQGPPPRAIPSQSISLARHQAKRLRPTQNRAEVSAPRHERRLSGRPKRPL